MIRYTDDMSTITAGRLHGFFVGRPAPIGGELLDRVLTAAGRFYSVDLLCDPPLRPYCERRAMRPVTGMALRNRAALDG
ncbi:hypothetical protein [Nonomuraea aridisoli]|uniref:Uncharacterized protein n=1 Tax=Nonomuraea aridisoli TaxID=2070368 RepID=A0A2W2F1P2_9ACTN|nr:hypothetical protein [Nonomuraea aridisoli]PZG22225.1 hypothetical protein C1J01_04350 [Nonomuraea aridisoli]